MNIYRNPGVCSFARVRMYLNDHVGTPTICPVIADACGIMHNTCNKVLAELGHAGYPVTNDFVTDKDTGRKLKYKEHWFTRQLSDDELRSPAKISVVW